MKKDKLDTIDKKINILIKLIILIVLIAVVATILYFLINAGISYIHQRVQTNEANKNALNEASTKAKLTEELATIHKVGEQANIGDLKLTLSDKKKLDTLPAEINPVIPQEGKERDVYGLKFIVENNTGDNKYFHRAMGWIATEDNPGQEVDVYPFADDNYLKQLGDYYTFDNRDLLIPPHGTKETWIVIEVETDIKGVFLYPTQEPNSKWAANY